MVRENQRGIYMFGKQLLGDEITLLKTSLTKENSVGNLGKKEATDFSFSIRHFMA
jgi:hypothetical protein